MQHPDEGTIHAWLDGALGADEAAQIEAHVKDCAECAAAVAEARGFIAASSRILTALDNAPRGVIPAAPAKRRFDPTAWRIAATVLVVAGGTLLVVRNQGTKETPAAASTLITDGSAPAAAFNATVESTEATANTAPSVAPLSLPTENQARRATQTAGGTAIVRPKAGIGSQGDLATPAPPRMESRVQTAQKSSATSAGAGSEEVAAVPPPATTSRFLPSAGAVAGQGVAADAAIGPTEPLKVIGSPRRVGAKVTVYDVAGDTVTLTESQNVALSGAVAMGRVTTTQVQGEKAAARTSNAEPAAVGSDTRRPAAAQVSPAAPSAPLQNAAHPEDANTLHTITWVDPVTRNTMTLSGRMSEARLQVLKVRIERERAGAKDTP